MNQLVEKDNNEIATPHSDITPEPGSVAIMGFIEKALFSDNFDVDKLQKLFEVKKEWEANEARKAFNVAVAEFKKECPVVIKDLTNSQFDSKYVSKGNLVNTINPVLGKFGLRTNWDIDQTSGIKVTCTLTHAFGHSESVSMTAPEDKSGSKNPIQQIKSTKTYLEIATYESITGVTAGGGGDDDGNGTAPADNSKPKPQDKKPQPKQLQPYPDDKFQKNKESWRKLINDGTKSPQQVIASIQSRSTLTDKQRKDIIALKQIQEEDNGNT